MPLYYLPLKFLCVLLLRLPIPEFSLLGRCGASNKPLHNNLIQNVSRPKNIFFFLRPLLLLLCREKIRPLHTRLTPLFALQSTKSSLCPVLEMTCSVAVLLSPVALLSLNLNPVRDTSTSFVNFRLYSILLPDRV